MKSGFDVLGRIVVAVALMALQVFVYAKVVSVLWLWFAVPIFGVSALTLPQAYGLILLVSALRGYQNIKSSGETFSFARFTISVLSFALTGSLLLCIGWIVRLFV